MSRLLGIACRKENENSVVVSWEDLFLGSGGFAIFIICLWFFSLAGCLSGIQFPVPYSPIALWLSRAFEVSKPLASSGT